MSILSSDIPRGGFGRPLTSTERKRLNAAGYIGLSHQSIVVRAHPVRADRGHVFIPTGNNTFAAYGITVTTGQ